ncbi:MAG: diaminobutyrate acetyltransferase [Pseudomonadota bacterium]|uniref:diaminobutyrate acetyltransferase n=1 Tax=Pseudohongiella sp. O18 TaxID=2904248 RepID=UPI001F01AB42|nr:diaminobutyrate acetyltransferase [Pseudohongiella sp. O18]MEC8859424.1 diaminobutyrate acetyltransferase [Pseudomonadota bacterium]
MNTFQEAPALQERPDTNQDIQLRPPKATDGAPVHNLIRKSAFLDDNSLYCYLAICTHFAQTSVVATMGEDVVGVVTAYIPPEQPDTLFVWQVAVDTVAQKRGLASKMLNHILERDSCKAVQYVETTVTEDNAASRAMFASLARRRECEINESVMFDREEHFLNLHDTEFKLRIGPFAAANNQGETS